MIISIYKRGEQKPQQYSYPSANHKVIIGRNPKCDDEQSLVVEEPSASRTHLSVKLKGKQIKIKDMGSSNGTKLNQVAIEPNQWIVIKEGDKISLGDSQDKIQISLRDKEKQIEQSSEGNSSEQSRSRQKKKAKKFQDLCKELKISDSSLKMLKQMTSQRKSKQDKIKFLKLMGCKKIQQNWEQIQNAMKNQNKYTNSNKKANEELERQFELGRATFEKKGLGKR